jgi:rare lipoprotein A
MIRIVWTGALDFELWFDSEIFGPDDVFPVPRSSHPAIRSNRRMMVRFATSLGVLSGMLAMAGQADAADPHRGYAHAAAHAQPGPASGPDTDFAYGDAGSPDGLWHQKGTASYYGVGALSRYTASGAVFDKGAMTAAHAWLPFGTRVNVHDEQTGREIVVTITDRLPGTRRVIDLSVGAARELGILHRGLTEVSLQHAT